MNWLALSIGMIGAGVLVYYMIKKKTAPIDPLYDFENQSIEIDSVERIRVCKSTYEKPLKEYRFSDVKTLYDVLHKGLELSNNGPCLGKRESVGKGSYSWINYSDVIERVKFIASGLLNSKN